jgi:transcription termination factor NusB
MDKAFLEKQKMEAAQYFDKIPDSEREKRRMVSIILQYVTSLFEPERFSDVEKEDLRKLALELNYKEDTDFSKWIIDHDL